MKKIQKQIHVLGEGNTRTTTVFFIKYLRTLGFDAMKGNKALGKIVFLFGVLTLLVMCGINYLWANPNEILSSFQDDYAIGLIIPFDMVFGLITLWLRKKAKVYATGQKKMIKWGTILAVVSVVISFTPLQILIQGTFISLVHGIEVLNV